MASIRLPIRRRDSSSCPYLTEHNLSEDRFSICPGTFASRFPLDGGDPMVPVSGLSWRTSFCCVEAVCCCGTLPSLSRLASEMSTFEAAADVHVSTGGVTSRIGSAAGAASAKPSSPTATERGASRSSRLKWFAMVDPGDGPTFFRGRPGRLFSGSEGPSPSSRFLRFRLCPVCSELDPSRSDFASSVCVSASASAPGATGSVEAERCAVKNGWSFLAWEARGSLTIITTAVEPIGGKDVLRLRRVLSVAMAQHCCRPEVSRASVRSAHV